MPSLGAWSHLGYFVTHVLSCGQNEENTSKREYKHGKRKGLSGTLNTNSFLLQLRKLTAMVKLRMPKSCMIRQRLQLDNTSFYTRKQLRWSLQAISTSRQGTKNWVQVFYWGSPEILRMASICKSRSSEWIHQKKVWRWLFCGCFDTW